MDFVLQDGFWVVDIPLVRMVGFKFLAQFSVDHLLHSFMSSFLLFFANMPHLFIVWLIVSSQSPHNQHLRFCCILSIFALIQFVLMAKFCAAVRRDSVSLLRFPFLSYVNIFSCEISLICHLECPYKCFSSHFCFLIIVVMLVIVLFALFLVTVIILWFFYVVFVSSYECISGVFYAGGSSFSFFSWHV